MTSPRPIELPEYLTNIRPVSPEAQAAMDKAADDAIARLRQEYLTE